MCPKEQLYEISLNEFKLDLESLPGCQKLSFCQYGGSLGPGQMEIPISLSPWSPSNPVHVSCMLLSSLETLLLLGQAGNMGTGAQVGVPGTRCPTTPLWHCQDLLATSGQCLSQRNHFLTHLRLPPPLPGSSVTFRKSLQMDSCQIDWGPQMPRFCLLGSLMCSIDFIWRGRILGVQKH